MKPYQLFITSLTFLIFWSCSKNDSSLDDNDINSNEIEKMSSTTPITAANLVNLSNTLEAYPAKKGVPKKAYFDNELITYLEINGEKIFEGDIILTDEQLTSSKVSGRTGIKGDKYRWKNKKVYYEIGENLPNKKRVHDAIAHWESKTELRFIKRTTQENYIFFGSGEGCKSFTGKIGGRQKITLAEFCTTGNTIHEIGHAIGLFHEQSRSDRKDFITIHWKNIKGGYEYNFLTWKGMGLLGFDMGEKMDFKSIMMYHPYSYSKNDKPTITKKDGSVYQVQSEILSNGDIKTVKFMYRNE